MKKAHLSVTILTACIAVALGLVLNLSRCARADEELIEASLAGDGARVKGLLNGGANPNVSGEYGSGRSNYTPLMLASLNGHTDVVRALLDHGAKVEVTRRGRTAIWYAVENGRAELIELYSFRGWKSEVAKVERVLGLIRAACKGYRREESDPYPCFPGVPKGYESSPSLERFALNDEDVNCVDPEGYTPLMYAANLGLTQNVVRLLRLGALPELRSQSGHTARTLAVGAGHNDIVVLLENAARSRK